FRSPGDMLCSGLRDRRDPAQDEDDAGPAIGARSCPWFCVRCASGPAREPAEFLKSRGPAPRVRWAATRFSKNHLSKMLHPLPGSNGTLSRLNDCDVAATLRVHADAIGLSSRRRSGTKLLEDLGIARAITRHAAQ